MNLYQISTDLFEQLSCPGVDLETGEIDDVAYQARIDALKMSFDDKALNVAKVIKSLDAEALAIKNAMESMAERIASNNRRVEYLQQYLLSMCLQQDRWPSDAHVKLSTRKSSRVVIEDQGILPLEYFQQQFVETVDKKLIREHISAGKDVPGAHVETVQNLQIK